MTPDQPLLQDLCRKLSQYLANTPHARQHAIEAAAEIARVVDSYPYNQVERHY